MPKSFTELKPKLAVTVTVTKKVILVEGDAIAPINAGRVDPAVKRDGENGYYITAAGRHPGEARPAREEGRRDDRARSSKAS